MNPLGELPNWSLESQGDGKRLAIWVLHELEAAGPERCRADLPKKKTQAEPLMRAYAELLLRGTARAAIGFAAVLTHQIGARQRIEGAAEFYLGNFSSLKNWRARKRGAIWSDTQTWKRAGEPRRQTSDSFDWGSLNPGRRMLETSARSREAPDAPESTGPRQGPGSPDHDRA